MSIRRITMAALAAGVGLSMHATPADAQFWKKAKDAARRTVDAAKAQANEEFGTIMSDVASELVADGRFVAGLSPWRTAEGDERIEAARIAGMATIAVTANQAQLALCDTAGARPLQGVITLQGRTGSASALDAREYELPAPSVRVELIDGGRRIGGEISGTLRIESVADDLVVGAARLTVSSVRLPGETSGEDVDQVATFRARTVQGAAPGSCGTTRGSLRSER